MRYLEMALGFASVGFVVANAAISLLTILIWRATRRRRLRADSLFVMRMLPAIGSATFLFGVILPAFFSSSRARQPNEPDRRFSFSSSPRRLSSPSGCAASSRAGSTPSVSSACGGRRGSRVPTPACPFGRIAFPPRCRWPHSSAFSVRACSSPVRSSTPFPRTSGKRS